MLRRNEKIYNPVILVTDKNGPADKAGIEASDVILKFDGKLRVRRGAAATYVAIKLDE